MPQRRVPSSPAASSASLHSSSASSIASPASSSRPGPASTPDSSSSLASPLSLPSPLPLPFPLRFVLKAAGVARIDAAARRSLLDAFTREGWPGVLRATAGGRLRNVKRIAVPTPPPATKEPGRRMTCGYRVRYDPETGHVACLWPRLRPETKADRVLGADQLLQVEFAGEGLEQVVGAGGRRGGGCFNCGGTGHFVNACPRPKRFKAGSGETPIEKQERLMARDELKEKIFPRLFRLALCDRTYEFVGGKDAGKGARLPGKGGIVYFLAVNGPPCDKPPSGFWTVEAAWRALADFRRCATVPKMCARLELAFSATAPALVEADGRSYHALDLRGRCGGVWSQFQGLLAEALARARAGSRQGDIFVVAVDDVVGRLPSGEAAVDPAGGEHLMTDGCGMASANVVQQIAAELGWTSVPLQTQLRAWWGGSLAKGVLSTSAVLPPSTILVRASQIKVDAVARGPPCGNGPHAARPRASLEINGRQRRPSQAHTSPFLVPLLEALGGPPMVELLLELQSAAAEPMARYLKLVSEGRELSDDDVVSLARQVEPMPATAALPGSPTLLAMLMTPGIDTRDEHVRSLLMSELKRQLAQLRRGRFAIADSMTLMASVDHTGTLGEGEVVCLEHGRAAVLGRCLLYKSPGIHLGDVRAVRAVAPTPAMSEHLAFAPHGQHGLIVSCQGERSVLDMIAGSDADGDCFTVLFNERLLSLLPDEALHRPWVKQVKPPPPTARPQPSPPKPLALGQSELLRAMKEHLIRLKQGHDLVTKTSTAWKVNTDKHGARHHDSLVVLVHLNMEALDSGKSGALPTLPSKFQTISLPPHLQKPRGEGEAAMGRRGGQAVRGAGSALLRMYEAVEFNVITGIVERQECPPVWIDPDLARLETEVPPDQRRPLMDKWLGRATQYSQDIKEDTKARGGGFDSEAWMRIVAHYRALLVDGEDLGDPSAQLRSNCYALYEAIYLSRSNEMCGWCAKCREPPASHPRNFRFVWAVAGDLLLFLKATNRRRATQAGLAPEARTAPSIVDPGRFHLLTQRRDRRAIHPDETAPGEEEELDPLLAAELAAG